MLDYHPPTAMAHDTLYAIEENISLKSIHYDFKVPRFIHGS